MILRLSSPRARGLLVLLALIFGAGLPGSCPRYGREGKTPQGSGLQRVGEAVVSTAWTDDIPRTRRCTRIELSLNSGKDLRELQLARSRLPGAKFDRNTGAAASIDDMVLVPAAGESTKR
jgi:hypothetical protein